MTQRQFLAEIRAEIALYGAPTGAYPTRAEIQRRQRADTLVARLMLAERLHDDLECRTRSGEYDHLGRHNPRRKRIARLFSAIRYDAKRAGITWDALAEVAVNRLLAS